MHRSTERTNTTHVGSLARPTELLETMRDKETLGEGARIATTRMWG
jgi:methionine synthase II (cobalamin-independent)